MRINMKLTEQDKIRIRKKVKARFRKRIICQKIEYFFYNHFVWVILGIVIGYILRGFAK
jgi:hypothetical protein